MPPLPAYILAGGRSSRFGSDKARAILDGEPLLQRVARLIEPFATCITIVADQPDKYADLNLRTIPDLHPDLGPLAGLETALADLPPDEPWLLLCNCDAVILEPHWLETLLTARSGNTQAIAYHHNNLWQPLPALYARSITNLVTTRLQSHNRSLQRLLDQSNATPLPLPPDWPNTWQANTPADLRRSSDVPDRF